MRKSEVILSVRSIVKDYEMGEVTVHALRDVSFDIYDKELIVILGPSGSGKSTMLNIMGGIESPTSGQVFYQGKALEQEDPDALTRYRREHVGFVFQFYNLLPGLTALENISLAGELGKAPLDARRLLEEVGLSDRADHFPNRLSGGQQQRIAIARALCKNPDLSFQKEQKEKCTVMAQEDGIVTDLPVKELSFIAAGQPAAVISEEKGLYAEADVLTSAALYIKEGDPVRAEISLKGKNLLLEGKVTEVYDYAEQKTSALGLPEYRVRVRAELEEGPDVSHGIEGYGADLKFTLYRGENVLTVPAGAVFETDGKEFVYLVSGGRAVKTEVETEYKTAARAVIAGGLQEDSEVIREADAEGVFDGAKIRVRR